MGWCGWLRSLSSSPVCWPGAGWRSDPAAPSPSGDVVKAFLLILWLSLELCRVPPWAGDLHHGAVSRMCPRSQSKLGCVCWAQGGSWWWLIQQLPPHSCSWLPQGQNPFDLEFDQSNHLEPVFNFECPPRPGESWVLLRGSLPAGPSLPSCPWDLGPEGFGGSPGGAGGAVGGQGWLTLLALLWHRHAFKSTHRHP